MAAVIENWVKSKAGIGIALSSPNVVDQLYDGCTFFQLLLKYNIITNSTLRPSQRTNASASLALRNLRLLRPWFQSIGISLPDSDLVKISQKDRSKCLWLLFELHLRLESISKVSVTAREKARTGIRENVTLKRKPTVSRNHRDNSRSLREKAMIEIMKAADFAKRRQLMKTDNVENSDLHERLSFKQMVKFGTDSLFFKDIDPEHRRANVIKVKDAIYKLNVGNALLNDMWEAFLGSREDKFNKLLNNRLQEQNKYETELGVHLAEQNFKQHDTFPKAVDRHSGDTGNNIFTKMCLDNHHKLRLHKRLYKEKLERYRELKRKICQDTVSDMVDLAILISEFHSQNGVQPTRFIMNDWKELFFQGIPFFVPEKRELSPEILSGSDSECLSTREMSYDDIRTVDTQILLDRVTCEKLINFYVHSYLYLVGNWKIEYWPELGNGVEKLNIQGFIIHRLLECKYPLPNPPKPAKVDHLKVRSIIKNFFDCPGLQSVEILLKKPKIILIRYSDAVRYCIDVYEHEKSIISTTVPVNSGTQTKKKSKVLISKATILNEAPVHVHKAVQCPEIAEKHRFVRHSKVAQLGQLALDDENTLADNVLSTKIMVEYIQSLKNYNGFVLVDFPVNESQAVLLEFLITGRPIEVDILDYNIDGAVLKFIFSEMNPPYTIDTRKLLDLESLFSNLLLETTLEVIPTYYDIKKAMKMNMEEAQEEELENEEVFEENGSTEISCSRLTENTPPISNTNEFSEASNQNVHMSSSNKSLLDTEPNDDYVGLLEVDNEVDKHTRTVSFVELRQLRSSKMLPRPNETILTPPNTKTIITSCIVKFTEVKQSKITSASLLAVTKASIVEQNKGAMAYAKLVSPQNYYRDFNVLTPYIQSDMFNPTDVARLILNQPIQPDHPQYVPSEELFGFEALSLSKKYKVHKIKRLSPISFNVPLIKSKTEVGKDKKHLKGKKNRKNSFVAQQTGSSFQETPSDSEIGDTTEFPVPGSRGWNYANEPLPEDFQIALASHWEIVEYVYLESLYQIMHLFHVHSATFFPHRNFIRNLMNEDVDHNSCRQQMVSNFQTMFNEIDDVHRRVPEMKTELHCKVHELWNRLCEMADSNKRVLELQLNQIMEEGKFLDYCYTVINIFLSLMQIEVDRYVDTVQILNEYYLKMLYEDHSKIKIEKIQIVRIVVPFEEDLDCAELPSDLKNTLLGDSVRNLRKLNDMIFLDRSDLDILCKMVKTRINQIAKKSNQCSKAVESMVNDNSVGVTLRRKIKQKLRKKTRARKAIVAPNLQRALNCTNVKIYASISRAPTNTNSGVNDFYLTGGDLIDTIKWEWSTAVRDEGERLHFRVKLIEAKMKSDLNETFVLTKNFYKSFVTDIAVRYHHEQQAIQRLCKVLRSAINAECAIRPKLILEKDRFYMGTEGSFCTGMGPPPPTPWRKVSDEYCFTMEQINNFVKKMKYVAPGGLIGVPFVQILEDMVSYTTTDHHPYLPVAWRLLDKVSIEYILCQTFGTMDVLDWRDFVIFSMNIPFPKIDYLFKLMKAYQAVGNIRNEHISYEHFKTIPLWFESQRRVADTKLAKDILFKLYQVNGMEMNYGAFLLAFCKGEDNLEGFMKMLTLMDDKGLLIDAEPHIEKAKINKEAKEIVRQIMNIVLHEAVLKADDIIIKTLVGTETKNSGGSKEKQKPEHNGAPNVHQDEYTFEQDFSNDYTSISSLVQTSQDAEVAYPERYHNPMWHVCVPFQLVFKLLSIACKHKLGSDQLVRQLKKKLTDLYKKEGKDGYVEACVLAESSFLKMLFDTVSIFKWCDMPFFVESFVKSSFVTNTRNSSVGL